MFKLVRHRPTLPSWDGPGRVVTVWGPTGSPGRSTLAAALAGALAPAGSIGLVDADCLRGSLGPLLGVTGGGNIVSATTAPAPPGGPCRTRDLHEHRAGFWLIRGVPGPAQEAALVPGDVATLLARLRAHYDVVIVDVGAALPPREFGDVHLAALRAADLVLAVGALSAVGLSDLLLQIRILVERLDPPGPTSDATGSPVWCVCNKGRGALLRQGPRRIVAETGLPVVATVPLDARNVAAAEEARLPLTVARPRSPAATVITGVAIRLWRTLAQTTCPAILPHGRPDDGMGTFAWGTGNAHGMSTIDTR